MKRTTTISNNRYDVEMMLRDIDLSNPSNIEISFSGYSEVSKRNLISKIENLGFKHCDSITNRTKILVTDRADGPKYRGAAEALYPIVHSDWVHRSHEAAKPLDLRKYILPALAGLTICVTGGARSEREKIEELARSNGAMYSSSLTQSVTHLIAETTVGEKIAFAKKLKERQKTNKSTLQINIVDKSWFYESVERRMALDPLKYEIEYTSSDYDAGPIASQAQVMQTQRMQSQVTSDNNTTSSNSNDMIDDFDHILDSCGIFFYGFSPMQLKEAHGYVTQFGGKVIVIIQSTELTHIVLADEAMRPNIVVNGAVYVVRYDWLVDSCNHQRRMNESQYIVEDIQPPVVRQPVQQIRQPSPQPHQQQPQQPFILRDLEPTKPEAIIEVAPNKIMPDLPPIAFEEDTTCQEGFGIETEDKLFTSTKVYIHPRYTKSLFKNGAKEYLASRGAAIVNYPNEATYILCNSLLYDQFDQRNKQKYVTEFFFKACVTADRILKLSDDDLFSTISLKNSDCLTHLVAKNGKKPVFSCVDIKQFDSNYSKIIIEGLGAVQNMAMDRTVDYLVCGATDSAGKKKYEFAKKKSIPILDVEYLHACARAGEFINPVGYEYTPGQLMAHSIPDPQLATSTTPVTTGETTTIKASDAFPDLRLDDDDEPAEEEEYEDDSLSRDTEPNYFGTMKDGADVGSGSNQPLYTQFQFSQAKTQHMSQDEPTETERVTRASIESGTAFVSTKTKSEQQKFILDNTFTSETERDRAYNESLRLRRDSTNHEELLSTNISTLADESQVVQYEIQREVLTKPPPKKVFLLSGDKTVSDKILKLGGEVTQTYAPEVTHLVASILQKTEKFLVACAAGIPIVHPKYIEDCFNENQWIQIEPYLFIPQNVERLNLHSSTGKELLPVVESSMKRNKRPFQDWCVEIYASKKHEEQFIRIFQAGGAIVTNTLSMNKPEPTAIMFHKDIDLETKKTLWKRTQEDDIPVISVEYVLKYVIDPEADPKPYYLKNPELPTRKRKNESSAESGSSDVDHPKKRARKAK